MSSACQPWGCFTWGAMQAWLSLCCLLCPTVKPSKPRCWMDGKLLEGSDVKLSCKSSDGSDPISYKWERVLDKGKSVGKLPPLALIGKRMTAACKRHPSPLTRQRAR